MASGGEDTGDDMEVSMETNTLIEKDRHLELYRGKRKKQIEVTNFIVIHFQSLLPHIETFI